MKKISKFNNNYLMYILFFVSSCHVYVEVTVCEQMEYKAGAN